MSEDPLTELTDIGSSSAAPGQVAHYRILQKVGEGGMGEVYLAEQERPVRRRVALKLIKSGMDTKGVVARFESERQALALMNHPSIARVYDAGANEHGRPYFAMEYVKGLPILEYCDTLRLGIAERLELFMQICEGVQHAHQKGVIHRDIKPSNVLVAVQDGKPVPKIIDFGVAKATEHRLSEQSVFTELGQLIGTPEYMSPEQAEMSGLDIDTRSDLYSLGVVLYELLTGALPFDSETLREGGLWEVRRRIREVEPQRPSARLHALGRDAEGVARQRRTDPTTLGRQVRGDLDWITMKALEKDRVRRYGSASELLQDIRRHLVHEPVLASPPSTTYRVRKFVKRHRLGVLAGALVLLAMIAGTALATLGMLRAVRAERLARDEAATANLVSEFMEGLFKVADPSEARDHKVDARDLLDKGAARVQTELQGQPAVQARMMGTMGRVYQSLGLYEQAEPLLVSAARIRSATLGEDHLQVAESLGDLGWLRQSQGLYDESVALHQRALGIREVTLGPSHVETARGVYFLAAAHARKGDYDQARPLYERAIRILEQEAPPEDPYLSWCLQDLAIAHVYSEEHEEARLLFERALGLKERIFGLDHADVARTLTAQGYNAVLMGDYATARALLQRAKSINDRTLGPNHPDSANTVHSMGELLRRTGDPQQARPMLEQALKLQERTLDPENLDVAITLQSLAAANEALGDLGRAEALYRRALAIRQRILPPGHRHLAQTLEGYAGLLDRLGRDAEADALRSRARGSVVRSPVG